MTRLDADDAVLRETGADRDGSRAVLDHGSERVSAPPLPGVRLARRRRRI